jgi:hypothetical protein
MNTMHERGTRLRRLGRGAAVCGLAVACLWGGAGPARADTPKVRGYFEVGRALVEQGQAHDGLLYVAVAIAVSPADLAAQTYLLTVLDRDCCRAVLGLHESLHAVLPGYRPLTQRLARLKAGRARDGEVAVAVSQDGRPPAGPGELVRVASRTEPRRVVSSSLDAPGGPGDRPEASASTLAMASSGDGTVPPGRQWNPVSLEPDARTGNPMAMFVTGRKYIVNGTNAGRQDWIERGLAYLDGSAKQGFTAARRFLGALYLSGELVPPNVARGIAHYERAASAGDVIAQRQLADMYYDGVHVPQNYSRAVFWYQTILHNPNGGQTAYKSDETWRIELRLAGLYLEGKGVDKDPIQARALWEHAARSSKAPPALEALGEAFEKGLGGDQRDQHALMMYAAAARGYLDHGYEYGLDPDAARHEARTILRAMERIGPEARLTRELSGRLAALSAAP